MTVLDEVLDVVRSFGPIRSEEVAEETHASAKSVSAALRELRDEGLVAREGSANRTRWAATEGPVPYRRRSSRDVVLAALRRGPSTLYALSAETGLATGSVYHALRVLAREGRVAREGRCPAVWSVADPDVRSPG